MRSSDFYSGLESGQRDTFVLKGAMLFVAWEGSLHRPTKDLDLLGFGPPSVEDAAARIREIAEIQCDDGIVFDTASVETEVINEDTEYEGVRARFTARLNESGCRSTSALAMPWTRHSGQTDSRPF